MFFWPSTAGSQSNLFAVAEHGLRRYGEVGSIDGAQKHKIQNVSFEVALFTETRLEYMGLAQIEFWNSQKKNLKDSFICVQKWQ